MQNDVLPSLKILNCVVKFEVAEGAKELYFLYIVALEEPHASQMAAILTESHILYS